ncbi:hypothetical protein ACG7TL_006136 [Trametes sanguinea]
MAPDAKKDPFDPSRFDFEDSPNAHNRRQVHFGPAVFLRDTPLMPAVMNPGASKPAGGNKVRRSTTPHRPYWVWLCCIVGLLSILLVWPLVASTFTTLPGTRVSDPVTDHAEQAIHIALQSVPQRPNFALVQEGARVVSRLTHPNNSLGIADSSLPEDALQDSLVYPHPCWSFPGSRVVLWGVVDGQANHAKYERDLRLYRDSVAHHGPGPLDLFEYTFLALAAFEYDAMAPFPLQMQPVSGSVVESRMVFGVVVVEHSSLTLMCNNHAYQPISHTSKFSIEVPRAEVEQLYYQARQPYNQHPYDQEQYAQLVQPHAQPRPQNPYAQLEERYAQPEQPYAQPEQLYAQPEQPYARPKQPYAQPNAHPQPAHVQQPYANPEQSYAQPEQPYAQQEQPPPIPISSRHTLNSQPPLARPQQRYGPSEQLHLQSEPYARCASYANPDGYARPAPYARPQVERPLQQRSLTIDAARPQARQGRSRDAQQYRAHSMQNQEQQGLQRVPVPLVPAPLAQPQYAAPPPQPLPQPTSGPPPAPPAPPALPLPPGGYYAYGPGPSRARLDPPPHPPVQAHADPGLGMSGTIEQASASSDPLHDQYPEDEQDDYSEQEVDVDMSLNKGKGRALGPNSESDDNESWNGFASDDAMERQGSTDVRGPMDEDEKDVEILVEDDAMVSNQDRPDGEHPGDSADEAELLLLPTQASQGVSRDFAVMLLDKVQQINDSIAEREVQNREFQTLMLGSVHKLQQKVAEVHYVAPVIARCQAKFYARRERPPRGMSLRIVLDESAAGSSTMSAQERAKLLLKEKQYLAKLQNVVRKHLQSLLEFKDKDYKTMAEQNPPLTDAEIEEYEDDPAPSYFASHKFRVDFVKRWSSFSFNVEARDYFVHHLTRAFSGGAYKSAGVPARYITHKHIGAALDTYMETCRSQYRKVATPPEQTVLDFRKARMRRNSRKNTLFMTRQDILTKKGWD